MVTIHRTAFGGMRVVEAPHMVQTVEDWSKVRSPSRARRRMRYGHRQNIVYRTEPRMDAITDGHTIYMHPVAIKRLSQLMNNEMDRMAERAFLEGMML